MSEYVVSIEGQTIPVPAEIGADDESVKRALAPFYPEVANAMITRVEKDDVITVTVVKRAGTKGIDSLSVLRDCQGGKNPAVALYEEIQERGAIHDPEQLLALNDRLETALEEGQEQAQAVEHATKRLAAATPRPAPEVVQGF